MDTKKCYPASIKTTDVLEADLISERDEIHGMKLDDYIFLL